MKRSDASDTLSAQGWIPSQWRFDSEGSSAAAASCALTETLRWASRNMCASLVTGPSTWGHLFRVSCQKNINAHDQRM